MLTAMSNSGLPIVAPAAAFIKNKVFLVICYLMLGLAIVGGGYGLSQLFLKQRTEVKLAKTETKLVATQQREGALSGIVDQQVKTIGTVSEMRESDGQLAARLLVENKKLAKQKADAEKRLEELERQNETVRTYLNQRVPAELGCMLNDTCPAGNPNGTGLDEAVTASGPNPPL